jgi:hypothetical protein
LENDSQQYRGTFRSNCGDVSATCLPLQTEVEIELVVSVRPRAPKAWLRGLMQALRVEDNPRGGCGFSRRGEAFTFCIEAKE